MQVDYGYSNLIDDFANVYGLTYLLSIQALLECVVVRKYISWEIGTFGYDCL